MSKIYLTKQVAFSTLWWKLLNGILSMLSKADNVYIISFLSLVLYSVCKKEEGNQSLRKIETDNFLPQSHLLIVNSPTSKLTQNVYTKYCGAVGLMVLETFKA